VHIPSTSNEIPGLYNLWKEPFYELEEDSYHYGIEEAKDNLRYLNVSLVLQISIDFLSKIIQRLLLRLRALLVRISMNGMSE
jgi:hypothetical protein